MQLYHRIKQSPLFQQLLRTLQFLSAAISLGLFTARLVKILRIGYKAYRASNGAVEGILCAAVAYTLISMLIRCALRQRAPPAFFRWLWIIVDILFVGAFIAVAYETRSGGKSGPCNSRLNTALQRQNLIGGADCNLPWGTFILAIFSTILHFLTVVFNEAREHYHRSHKDQAFDHEAHHGTHHGSGRYDHRQNQNYPGGMEQQANGRY